jgi:hypothetical protein
MLGPSLVASAATWLAGTVTVTVPAHGVPLNTSVFITMSGFAPAAYNGQRVAVSSSATTFQFPMATNPGAETALGTVSFMTPLAATATPNVFASPKTKAAPPADNPETPNPAPAPKEHSQHSQHSHKTAAHTPSKK